MTYRVPPVSEIDAAVRRHIETTSYSPTLPEGWPVDEYGLPIVEDHPDDPDV